MRTRVDICSESVLAKNIPVGSYFYADVGTNGVLGSQLCGRVYHYSEIGETVKIFLVRDPADTWTFGKDTEITGYRPVDKLTITVG